MGSMDYLGVLFGLSMLEPSIGFRRGHGEQKIDTHSSRRDIIIWWSRHATDEQREAIMEAPEGRMEDEPAGAYLLRTKIRRVINTSKGETKWISNRTRKP